MPGGTRGEGLLYLNVSYGKFVNKKKELAYDWYAGKLQKITLEDDEFEGKPTVKVHLEIIDDTGTVANIGFNRDTWFSIGFFSRITQVDLAKPFTIGVTQSEQNEKVSFCYMKQMGKKIEKVDDFPKPVDKEIGKNAKKEPIMAKDFSAVQDRIDKVMEALKDKWTPEQESAPTPEPETTGGGNREESKPEDPGDLPF